MAYSVAAGWVAGSSAVETAGAGAVVALPKKPGRKNDAGDTLWRV